MRTIVIKPHITELSMKDAKNGKFTFLVDVKSTKTDIKKDVQSVYGVTVTGVATVTIKRAKTIFSRLGKRKSFKVMKKARVSLAKGQTIPAFEVPEEGKKKKKDKKEE